jgi:hypothetical protein
LRPIRFLAGIALLVTMAACGYPDVSSTNGPVATEVNAPPSPLGPDDFNAGAGQPVIKLPDGLKYIDLKAGDGAFVNSGDKLTVQYSGWLSTGAYFDSSRVPGAPPFAFTLGAGEVIPGWDEGVAGMKVGGRRKLIVPPALGYGDQGQPPVIPPKATLVFIVEVVSEVPAPPSPTPTPVPSATPAVSPTP